MRTTATEERKRGKRNSSAGAGSRKIMRAMVGSEGETNVEEREYKVMYLDSVKKVEFTL